MKGYRTIQPTYAMRPHRCGWCADAIPTEAAMAKVGTPNGEQYWCRPCAALLEWLVGGEER